MKKIIIQILSVLLVGAGLTVVYFWDNPQFRLARQVFRKPIGQVIEVYAKKSCTTFSEEELKTNSFEALITGYCRPKMNDYSSRKDFLCAVGLNCACPAGREAEPNCSGKNGLTWSACKDFDEQTANYCHQTASQITPQVGHLAADWSCFKKNSEIIIDGKSYTVTDKGSAITGRRFDLWVDDCQEALKIIGIYKVKIPQ